MQYQRQIKSRDISITPIGKPVVLLRWRQLAIIFHVGLFSLFGGIFTPFQKAGADSSVITSFIAPSDTAILPSQWFNREIEVAFLDLGLRLTDLRTATTDTKNLALVNGSTSLFDQLSAALKSQKQAGLLIETSLSPVENDRVLPLVRITALPSGRLVSSVASLDVAQDVSRDELRIAALSLARRAIRQLQDDSHDLIWSNGAPWAGDEYLVTMTIENFNGCQQNYILGEMETKFPGFVAIDLVDASQSHYGRFTYRTTARQQRLTKWLHIFFIEHQMVPGQDFTILYHNKKLRLILENGAKFGTVCSAF
jgi:hypothetical protein